MIERKRALVKLFLAFFFVPVFWQVASKYSWMRVLENWTMDLRFLLRGDIEAELKNSSNDGKKQTLKLVYVNVDEQSVALMGEEPVPLKYYAETIRALIEYGKPKVIASDIQFIQKQHSSLADMGKIKEDETICRNTLSSYDNIVFSAWYNAFGRANADFTRNEHPLPLIHQGFEAFGDSKGKAKTPLFPPTSIVGGKPLVGIINTDPIMNAGLTVRWMPLYVRIQEKVYLTLSLEVARLFFGISQDAVKIYGDDSATETLEGKSKAILIGMNGTTLMDIPLSYRQLVEINWFSSWASSKNKYVNLANVIKHKDFLEKGLPKEVEQANDFFKQFKESIILLGNTHANSKTMIATPVDHGLVPSISAHGNLLKTLFSGRFIERLPWNAELIILLLINFFVASLTLYGEIFGRFGRIFVGLVIAYFGLCFCCFGIFSPNFHMALPMVSVAGSIATILLCGMIYQLIIERRQRIRIKSIFGNYLSPEVVSAMVEEHAEPQLGGVEKNITAFFSDIQSFSTFSEILSPSSLVSLMNEYLTATTEVIKEEGGSLDKFIGDAIVAMFGAPLNLEAHPLRACVAACRIQQKQAWLRDKWKKEADKWPKEILRMRTRVGLSSGLATVGNMGSATRFNYTMMGDTVNLAARCESGAKTYGVYTLISEDTYKAAVAENNEVVFRFVDRIVVKGRKQPIGVYEIVGLRKELPDSAFECVDTFEKGIQRYLAQDWEGALSFFDRSSGLELLKPGRDVGVVLNPSILFVKRCKYMKETPPEKDWDGVFVMQTK